MGKRIEQMENYLISLLLPKLQRDECHSIDNKLKKEISKLIGIIQKRKRVYKFP